MRSLPFLLSSSLILLPLLSDQDIHASDLQDRGDPWLLHVIDGSSAGADGVRVSDVNNDGLLDVTTGWEQGGIARVCIHPGYDNAKQPWPSVTVGPAPSTEDAVFGDFDGDGSVDVVTSCQGNTKRIFFHWAPIDPAEYMNQGSWQTATLPAAQGVMQWMFSLPLQVDGLHRIDLVAGGKNENAQIGWFEAPEQPRSLDQWIWHSMSPAGWVMSLIAEDMDGDGDRDIVTSDRTGGLRGARWLENPGPGPMQSNPWQNHFIAARNHEVTFMRIADLDQDGLDDALVAVFDSAAVAFARRLDSTGLNWQEFTIPYPPNTGTPKAVAVGDINRDGRQDLVLSCAHAAAPKSGVVWMSYVNSPFGAQWDAHEISGQVGTKFDRIELLDIDGDGDLDVLTTEEVENGPGLGVIWYENPLPPPPRPFLVVY